MPESPACSVRSSSSNCRFGSFFGAIRYWMLGRSKLATNWRAWVRCSRDTISARVAWVAVAVSAMSGTPAKRSRSTARPRSEEHTSELQSRRDLVCRLLLEKKKKKIKKLNFKKKKKKKIN